MAKVLKLLVILALLASFLAEDSSEEQVEGNEEEEKEEKKEDCQAKICKSKDCLTAASRILEWIDNSTNPCDDFYQYACGGWMQNQLLTKNDIYIKTMTDTESHTAFLRNFLKNEADPTHLSSIRKAKELFASCTAYATKSIDNSLKVIVNTVREKFGTWPLTNKTWDDENFRLDSFLTEAALLGVFPLFDISFHEGWLKEKHISFIKLSAPKLTLKASAYEDLLQDKTAFKYYADRITDAAKRFGLDEMEISFQDVENIINLEADLAEIVTDTTPDVSEGSTAKALNAKYGPLLDWTRFTADGEFEHILDMMIVLEIPTYLDNVTNLLKKISSRAKANYIIWQVIRSLEERLKSGKLGLPEVITKDEASTEEVACVHYTTNNMRLVIFRILYKVKFSPQEQKKVNEMLDTIHRTFNEIIKEHMWLDKETAKIVREKNANMAREFLFMKEAMDDTYLEKHYSELVVDKENLLENILKVSSFIFKKSLQEPLEYGTHFNPLEANAATNPSVNKMVYLPIIFEPPVFSIDVPESLNYGGIGFVIGHELFHGFDSNSYMRDKNGKVGEWWTRNTTAAFQKRHECLIDQYDNFFVKEADRYLNGTKTLGENIADQGGLKVAYKAYRHHIVGTGVEDPLLPGLDFTEDQLFFINMAQVWCTVSTSAFARYLINTDVHSPSKFRVIGNAQNSIDFSRAFRCPVGAKMNPEKKCEVW